MGSAVVGLLGLVVAIAGAVALGGLLLLTAVVLGFRARRWLALAGPSRVAARSEDDVQRALMPLHAEGWHVGHSHRAGWGRYRFAGDLSDLDCGRRRRARHSAPTPPRRVTPPA
jgi:hypothetical protein